MSNKQSKFKIFIFYFSILLLLGVFVRDLPGQPHLFATISNFMSPPGNIQLSDPKYFASGALDIYSNGWFSPENQWLIHLWPPGFMLLEGFILKLFGLDAPIIVILVVLSCLLAAVLLQLMREYLLNYVPSLIASLLPLLIFCFPVSRLFVLQPIGVVLGECFAIMFFLIGVVLTLLAVRGRSVVKAITAGVLLAVSAYFRSQFEIIVLFLTIGAVPFVVWSFFKLWSTRADNHDKAHFNSVIKVFLTTLLAAHLTMMPWRLHQLADPSVQRLTWVTTQEITYANAGIKTEELNQRGIGWIAHGGGNMACIVEPSYCGKADKYSYYQAFFGHIGEWYRRKLALVDDYWFSSLKEFTSSSPSTSLHEDVANLLLALCVLITWPLLWLARNSVDSQIRTWACISFYSCFFAVFTFVQFEVRYFYLMKIFSVFSVILMGAVVWRLRKDSTLVIEKPLIP